ncbi:uncharacterized protein LOC129569972 [Sitodiplosis mosellana]|uniref:uncharacterized protein LOC129569972 n=1 Tax=Sitodiplosis mosellana TaxID=263140 RepID=UPI002443D047|nr:uncharacterized protein LOC129569972 [Sitodiplosis mosellana]
MKFNQILCALFLLIVFYLTLFVSASTIQRSLSDDIRNGISIAGKILGVDSPSNIAIISNIAELVTRSFSKNTNANQPGSGWDRRQMTERYPTEHLEDFGETPQGTHQVNSNEQDTIDDNVIIGNNINTRPTTTTDVDHGFLGQVLRVMGMDTGKIGAMAVNGLIFIAQMIGRSLMSAFTTVTNKMGAKPNENIAMVDRTRRFENDNTDEEANSIWDNAIGWIIEQSKSSSFLSQKIDAMLDRDLSERLIDMVDNGNDDETAPNENINCVKQLLCKTAPFIWGMQKAVSAQMNTSDSEASATDETSNDNAKNASTDNDYRMNVFFKYMPSVDEFKNHGITCEDQYKQCKLF